MTIELLAIARGDCVGIIKNGGEYSLLYPYKETYKLNLKDIPEVIYRGGFSILGTLKFENQEAVIAYLKEEYIKDKKERGIKPITDEEARELLKYSTRDDLEYMLTSAESDLDELNRNLNKQSKSYNGLIDMISNIKDAAEKNGFSAESQRAEILLIKYLGLRA